MKPMVDEEERLKQHTDTLDHSDTYPGVLYDQHPEISSFNWDAVLPE